MQTTLNLMHVKRCRAFEVCLQVSVFGAKGELVAEGLLIGRPAAESLPTSLRQACDSGAWQKCVFTMKLTCSPTRPFVDSSDARGGLLT